MNFGQVHSSLSFQTPRIRKNGHHKDPVSGGRRVVSTGGHSPRSRWTCPRGFPTINVLLCVMSGVYLRLSQGFRLQFCNWAKPLRCVGIFYSLLLNPSEVGGISQTGFSDESVRWDVPYLTSVPKAIERLSIRVDPTRKISLCSYAQFLPEMNMSVERLRLPRLGPYQTRHSGASWGQMKSHHDQLQIQKRRRFTSTSSMIRF